MVCVGLGPYPFMLNTPPRARRPLRFQDSQETKGERVGQPIKKCAYTRLLISRRPFKVGGGGGGAIYGVPLLPTANEENSTATAL